MLTMAKIVIKSLTIAAVIIGLTASAWSQEINAGKTSYLSSCAPCHGADAKGNGFLSAVLTTPPGDLTTLTRRNGGVFPIAAVTEIIEGRTLIAAHGTRDMPIWGFDVMVRSRITLIVDYLNYIQEK
jgi:mono/diheme cytochrome c family protein